MFNLDDTDIFVKVLAQAFRRTRCRTVAGLAECYCGADMLYTNGSRPY